MIAGKNSRTATTYRWCRMVPELIRTIDNGFRNKILICSGGDLFKKKSLPIDYRSLCNRESMCSLTKYRFASENERYSSATEAPKRNRVQTMFYAYWRSPPFAPQGADGTRESHDLFTHIYCPPCRYQTGKFCLSQSVYSSIPSSLLRALSLSLFPSGYRSLLFPPRPVAILSIPPSTTRNKPSSSSANVVNSIYLGLSDNIHLYEWCTKRGVGVLRLTLT